MLCNADSAWRNSPVESLRIDTGTTWHRYSYTHTAIMTSISPLCYYEYQVSNGLLWSETHAFKGTTPGSPKESLESYQMLVLGDLGNYHLSEATLSMFSRILDAEEFLGFVHLGDIAYNLQDREGKTGDDFLQMIEPFAADYPYLVTPGNHDDFRNFTHFKKRFWMPRNEASQNSSYYFSMDLGYVHWVFLNSQLYIRPSMRPQADIMTRWLVDDLESANQNRESVPWIVVLHHHALYCTKDVADGKIDKDCEVQPAIMRGYLEDIYYNYTVDLVLQGHLHHYERLGSLYREELVQSEVEALHLIVNAKAPVYVISGNAGNGFGKNDPLSKDDEPWLRSSTLEFGFGKLQVVNKTTLFWQQYSSEELDIVDNFYLEKY